MPSPKEISDAQLVAMLESGDASQYRVPISLGEPHTVTDNLEEIFGKFESGNIFLWCDVDVAEITTGAGTKHK